MAFNSDQVTGFVVGLGVTALGFYLYKKNQPRVDQWLKRQGIPVPPSGTKSSASMTLEDLMTEKERLEDLIAEREAAAEKDSPPSPSSPK
ncbi:MAG: hypothetical protein ACYTG0_06305 [Planctomycetota bacterium]|jgi:hypothetical protein